VACLDMQGELHHGDAVDSGVLDNAEIVVIMM